VDGVTVADVVYNIQYYLFWILTILTVVGAVVSLIHAVATRPDAFTAVDAQSKVFWVVVTAVSTLVGVFLGAFSLLSMLGIFYLAAVVAVIVYLVDVRPRVDEVQGKSWFRKSA